MPPRPGAEPEQQWPPRSPHEALLSTPGGRERLRRLAERTSPSPSPSKRASTRTGSYPARKSEPEDEDIDLDIGDDEDEDEDEDEEMLQLKLAALQAKLKLKKLQSARAKKAQTSETHTTKPELRPETNVRPVSRVQARTTTTAETAAPSRPQSQPDIQIPASPVRKVQVPQESLSPSRVRLGIDKGLRAKDVSLKRVPDAKRPFDTGNSQAGGYLRRTNTPAPGAANQEKSQERPKSFSERLAAARADETSRQCRQEKINQLRSKTFQLGKQEMEELKRNATEIPEAPVEEENFSREDVMAGRGLRRSNTMPSLKEEAQNEDRRRNGHDLIEENETTEKDEDKGRSTIPPSEVSEEEASGFEPYSGLHLSKRIIPHLTLTRNLAGKKTLVIPDLLKHVKAPDYELPDIEQDIVVFAIIASKSDPRAHQNTGGSNIKEKSEVDPARGKYMVLRLVDLKWELELYLFNSGFERYWKLTPGTLLAILNPTIMPPPPNRTDTGRFSLVINSGHDTILEVGTARDLGFCKSIKKDGALCNSWVNAKRTEFCEFHMNLNRSRKQLQRQDVNAHNTGPGPRRGNSQRQRWGNPNDPDKKKRGTFDRETQSTWVVHKATAASLLDNEILGGGYGRTSSTIERSEALRRRLATEEKERNLMKKLGELGSGAGKEYMLNGQRSKSGSSNPFGSSSASTTAQSSALEDETRPRVDAKSLGLVADRNNKVHLSPVKRKRVESALSSRSSSLVGSTTHNPSLGKAALGWGGGLKDKLARMKDGEKLRQDQHGSGGSKSSLGEDPKERTKSPARKKTRFVTEKGIREAGRESLGGELVGGGGDGRRSPRRRMVLLDDDDDDDDDELVILK
ncbi:hypothetical protein GGS20DRAFT_585662 [Poronia punctata]|nr:hypothetical protein GGS20DRAFT_585662 [Poronia punctata]